MGGEGKSGRFAGLAEGGEAQEELILPGQQQQLGQNGEATATVAAAEVPQDIVS